jgi:hypothetical protein
MESRNRLAKVMVKLKLSTFIASPANLYHGKHITGTLTSSVTTPDGEHLGLGFVKSADARPSLQLTAGNNRAPTTITGIAGTPPPRLATAEPTMQKDA